MEVDWLPSNSPGVDNYRVRYHSVNPMGAWIDGGGTGDNTTVAIIDDIPGSKQYVFQVAAHNSDGWGDWSGDSQAIVPLGIAPPSGLAAAPGDGTVDLSWIAATPPPTGYDIQCNIAGGVGGDWAPCVPWEPRRPPTG